MQRYATFEKPLGQKVANGEATLTEMAEYAAEVHPAQRVVAQSCPVVRIPASQRVGTLTLEGLAVRGDSGQEAGPMQRAVAGRRFIQLAHELVEPGPLRALCC